MQMFCIMMQITWIVMQNKNVCLPSLRHSAFVTTEKKSEQA